MNLTLACRNFCTPSLIQNSADQKLEEKYLFNGINLLFPESNEQKGKYENKQLEVAA
jgi:hypothetical protein